MKHIDDGTLHAYLDGAAEAMEIPGGAGAVERHLASCAACRARLETERRVRERAGALLAVIAPAATEGPPFSDIGRRRAAAPAPDAGRGELPVRRLATAAMVVVALGTGWLARDVLRSPGGGAGELAVRIEPEMATPPVAADSPVSRPREPAGSRAAAAVRDRRPSASEGRIRIAGASVTAGTGTEARAPEVAADRPESPPPGAAAVAAPPPPPPPERVPSGQRAYAAARAVASTAAPAAPPASTSEAAPVRTPDARGARAAPVLAGRVIDEAGRPIAGAQVVETRHGLGAITDADGGYRIELPAAVSPGEPLVLTARVLGMRSDTHTLAAERRPLRRDFVLTPATVVLDGIIVTGAGRPESDEWTVVGMDDAEAALGRPLPTVPRLPVAEVAVSASRDAVRVTQTLEGGAPLCLVLRVDPEDGRRAAQRNEESAVATGWREEDASDRGGVSRVRMRSGALVLEAEAALPIERLRALLRALR